MHGVMWLPLNSTFSTVPSKESTRGVSVSSRIFVSSIVSELNFTNNVCLTLYEVLKQSRFSDGVGLNSETPLHRYTLTE